jgi:hypothetical protein
MLMRRRRAYDRRKCIKSQGAGEVRAYLFNPNRTHIIIKSSAIAFILT